MKRWRGAGAFAAALAALGSLRAPALSAPEGPGWAWPVQLEEGQLEEGKLEARLMPPWAIPLGIGETAGGKVCALYGLRSEHPGRYAVYARWSPDGGRTWEDRKLLGLATWVATGAAQTLVPQLVDAGGRLFVVGAWEGSEAADGDEATAEQTVRVHSVDPSGIRLEVEAKLPQVVRDPQGPPTAHWVHRLGMLCEGPSWRVWGIRGRDAAGRERPSDIELQPFEMIWDRKAGRLGEYAALGPWKPAERGIVSDTIALRWASDRLQMEGFDLEEGGWVAGSPGDPASRRVQDWLSAYREQEVPIARAWRWEAKPSWRLVTFIEERHPRSALVEEASPGRWRILPVRWEQPSYLWSVAPGADRCAMGLLTGFAERDPSCKLCVLDAQGRVVEEPAFAGLRQDLDVPTVCLGSQGRIHVLVRCNADQKQFLLVRSKRQIEEASAPDREALRLALREMADPDLEKAASARAYILRAGPQAVGILREAGESDPGLSQAAREMASRLLPPWADPGPAQGGR